MYDVRTLTEHVERNLFIRRIPARMFVVLGPLAAQESRPAPEIWADHDLTVTQGLEFWFDASRLSKTLADSEAVKAWPDASGNRRDLSSAAPAVQPRFRTQVGASVVLVRGDLDPESAPQALQQEDQSHGCRDSQDAGGQSARVRHDVPAGEGDGGRHRTIPPSGRRAAPAR